MLTTCRCTSYCSCKRWKCLWKTPNRLCRGCLRQMYKFTAVLTVFLAFIALVRGLFKKFCYERLSIRKDNVCLTDFVHKYFSFFYTCTCEISKESSKYQYSYWHLKWPQSYTLTYIWRWKGGKCWTRRCYSSQKVVLRWKVGPQKRMGNKLLRIIQNICYFNAWLSIWKWHKFGIKECYPKRGHKSYITEYRLLMWISRLWNKDKNNGTYHSKC